MWHFVAKTGGLKFTGKKGKNPSDQQIRYIVLLFFFFGGGGGGGGGGGRIWVLFHFEEQTLL